MQRRELIMSAIASLSFPAIRVAPAGPRAAEFRAALTAWLDANAAFRRHYLPENAPPDDGTPYATPESNRFGREGDRLCGAAREAAERLMDMVRDAYPAEPATEPGWRTLAVDIGETLIVVGVHHADITEEDPECMDVGTTMLVLDKADIVRA